jgi:hypothetical protein
MSEQPSPQRPRWIMYWVSSLDGGRATIRTQALVAGRRAQRSRQDLVLADQYAHVDHFPWEHLPNSCTACQLRQKMLETLP